MMGHLHGIALNLIDNFTDIVMSLFNDPRLAPGLTLNFMSLYKKFSKTYDFIVKIREVEMIEEELKGLEKDRLLYIDANQQEAYDALIAELRIKKAMLNAD